MTTKTYTSFVGSDFVLLCNGKVYGDMQACRVNSINKTIEIDFNVFSFIPKTEFELRSVNNGRFVEVFINEYDDKIFKVFTGVKYKGYKSNHAIDDCAIISTLIFDYESDTPFSNLECPFTDFIDNERKLNN
jgi:hypothetical protein|nr:MAG TPA: hypothetical protein [Caudoviricetes sp.]